MGTLKYVELAFGWLAGVATAVLAIVPLLVPDESSVGQVIIDGKVVSEVHHELWLVDILGVGGTAVLLSVLMLLAITLAAGVTLHVRKGRPAELVTLWIAPAALAVIFVEFWRELGVWLEYLTVLGLVCAVIASIRQVGLWLSAAPR